jgi:hypothetical protein
MCICTYKFGVSIAIKGLISLLITNSLKSSYFYYYDKIKTFFFYFIINKFYFILLDFLYNYIKFGLIYSLENLFSVLLTTVIPRSYRHYFSVLALLGLSFNDLLFTQGELYNLPLVYNNYICTILTLYILFIVLIDCIYRFIKKGVYLKLNYPLVYNFLLILFSISFFLLVIFSCFYIIKVISIITGHILEYIDKYILKMMRFGGSSNPRGGFGQPSGGGGRPPRKPQGPQGP